MGFSSASRMRALRALARIDWPKTRPNLFVTLTYPDKYLHVKYKQRTKDLYIFHRYMEKHVGMPVPVFWRTEWEIRKTGEYKGFLVPHHHLMCLGVRFLDHVKVREWWRNILHAEGPLCTDVRRITGEDGACRYMCYYLAKSRCLDYSAYLNSQTTVGRQWGFKRKALIPHCRKVKHRRLTDEELAFYRSYLNLKKDEGVPEWLGSFTLFNGDLAEEFTARMENRVAPRHKL